MDCEPSREKREKERKENMTCLVRRCGGPSPSGTEAKERSTQHNLEASKCVR